MAAMLAKMKTAAPAMTLLGSSWSAPGWMKRNGHLTGNATNNNLQDTYLNSTETDYSHAFAQYFVKYLQAYQNAGAPVSAITLQNEPLYSTDEYPSMYIYDYESALLIKNRIAPAFSQAGLNTEIWAHDHNTGNFILSCPLACEVKSLTPIQITQSIPNLSSTTPATLSTQ